jgi:hypothetical protein
MLWVHASDSLALYHRRTVRFGMIPILLISSAYKSTQGT